ncbi:hypothetical protein SBRCBS47491_001498 [Sporothrix bragantina]|uniref:F-box domain-containing protein n=1 Tax=Sporothrix bragantina TaxID=671064 RepID=A0ABP0AZK2_9PEZI
MDTLPVELLRLILDYCDPASVRGLRLLTPTLADLGYDYLLRPDFCALPWRDDVARLRAIASHDRLRSSISSVTFNFTEIDAENARQVSHSNTSRDTSEHKDAALTKAWRRFAEFEQRRQAISPLHAQDPADLAAAFRPLVNLRDVAVTFRQAPYDIDELKEAMAAPSSLKMNHEAAVKRLNVLMAALQLASVSRQAPSGSGFRHSARSSQSSRGDPFSFSSSSLAFTSPSSMYASVSAPVSAVASAAPSVASTRASSPVSSAMSSPSSSSPGSPSATDADAFQDRCRLKSFSVDRLPLELLRNQVDRRLWFQCREVFSGLTRLDLTLDTSNVSFPLAKFKAVNGLGYVLRMAPNLTHLSLSFHNQTAAREIFILSLRELLGETGSLEGPPLSSSNSSSGVVSAGDSNETGFRFRALTDLKLDGIACDEAALRGFLLRHASTLERLRLGGRGRAHDRLHMNVGGMRLSNGTFWSLFRSLRGGRLPHLQQMHLEGTFFCQSESLIEAPDAPPAAPVTTAATAPANPLPNVARTSYEHYNFRPTTDDNWDPIPEETLLRTPAAYMTSEKFEAYLLGHINEYPGSFRS